MRKYLLLVGILELCAHSHGELLRIGILLWRGNGGGREEIISGRKSKTNDDLHHNQLGINNEKRNK